MLQENALAEGLACSRLLWLEEFATKGEGGIGTSEPEGATMPDVYGTCEHGGGKVWRTCGTKSANAASMVRNASGGASMPNKAECTAKWTSVCLTKGSSEKKAAIVTPATATIHLCLNLLLNFAQKFWVRMPCHGADREPGGRRTGIK